MLATVTHDDLLTSSVGLAVSKVLTFLAASAEEINIQVREGALNRTRTMMCCFKALHAFFYVLFSFSSHHR